MATAMQSKSTETPPRTRRHGTTATNSRRRMLGATVLAGVGVGLLVWALLSAADEGILDPDNPQVFVFSIMLGIAILATVLRMVWLAVIAAALALVSLLLGGILSVLGNLSLGSGPLIWAMSFALFAFVIMACLWFYKKVWKA